MIEEVKDVKVKWIWLSNDGWGVVGFCRVW